MAEATLAALEARLKFLETERNIVATMYRYAHSIDYGLEESWADCFTHDGVFDIQYQHAPNRKVEGRAELISFAQSHSRAPEVFHKHVMVEPVIELSDDMTMATVTSYFMRIDDLSPGSVIRCFGRYHDQIRLCDDGRWRIRSRQVRLESHSGAPSTPRREMAV